MKTPKPKTPKTSPVVVTVEPVVFNVNTENTEPINELIENAEITQQEAVEVNEDVSEISEDVQNIEKGIDEIQEDVEETENVEEAEPVNEVNEKEKLIFKIYYGDAIKSYILDNFEDIFDKISQDYEGTSLAIELDGLTYHKLFDNRGVKALLDNIGNEKEFIKDFYKRFEKING